ncbi:hypothetical protein ABTY96_46960 [Streptomyces sp. NPDC096057]|uniref:hypothetical protein n=1 Tax=Streptomyces sp. NPDC096057 TaxID=3155543 RepID=UPI00332FB030
MAGPSYRYRTDAALRGGEPQKVLDVAVAAYEASAGDLLTLWGQMIHYLGGQPAEVRAGLLDALPGRYRQAPPGSGLRNGLLHLAVVLGRGLPLDVLAAERREAVTALGDRWAVEDRTLLHLARAELAADAALPAAAVATVRRSAKLTQDPGWAALAARLTQPLLNVGEPWAEAALADVSALGPDWQALVAHAGTAWARPTAGWERAALGLLARVGEEAARERILSWLPLVGLARTRLPAEHDTGGRKAVQVQADPFNADFLRGLVLLLSVRGPGESAGSDERTVSALGSLIDTCTDAARQHGGPPSAKIANAAVVALGRLGDPLAVAELRRLAARTSYGNTRRLIDRRLLRTS